MNIGNTSGNRVKTTNNDFQIVRTGRYKVPRPKVFNPSTSSISSPGPSRPINFDSARLPFRPDWTPVTSGSAAIRGTPATRTDIASPAVRLAAKNNSSCLEVLMKAKSSDPELSKNKIHQQVANLVACSTPRQLIAPIMSTNELQSTFSENLEARRIENHVKQPSTSTTSKPSETTKTTTLTNSVILVLTIGRCSAQGEVGLASIDLKRPVLTLCQISDTQNYANTITKINIFNPAEIVVPDTFMEQVQGTVIYEIIKSQFPLSTMITASRKHFCENQGKKYLKNAVLPECLSILEQTLTKYYAVSAAAALFKHIEFNHKTVFSSNTLQLEYVGVEKSMFIDTNTAIRLELVLNSTSINPKNSLYGALNYCSTIGGRRRLRSCILQPSTDIQLIHDRQTAVEELMVTEEGDLKLLNNTMDKFSDVEKLYWLCTKVPKDSLNMSKLQGNYTLQLKSTLDVLPVLVDILKPFKSHYIRQIRKALTDSGYSKMLQIVETTINKEATRSRGYSQSQFQRCFAIKTNLNPLLDITRTNYSELIKRFHDKVNELGEQFQTDGLIPNNSTNRGFHVQLNLKNVGRFDVKNPPSICKQVERTKSVLRFTTNELIELNYRINQTLIEVEKLTNEILFEMLKELRKYIGRVYDLCNGIADLDLVLSFVKFSKKPGLCKPTFGQNIDIVNGKHPILELISVPVGNDVFASTDKNLTIITGPNMGGKSIYIRQVALLQIIAQIGCYVPAASAQFRMCDRLLTRLGFGDSIESNASTWVLEIKEINGFLPVLSNNSLVIIDELCRATTSEEGSSLAWAICEHLMQYRAFIFIATHSILLTKLQDLYCNVQNFHMEALSDSDNGLCYTHKLKPGVTRIDHYGLALARDIKMPENLVDYASEIEKCLFNTESALADSSPNAANRILDDFVVELLRLKDNELINPDKVSDLATIMIEELEKDFQVSINCSDSSNDIMDTI